MKISHKNFDGEIVPTLSLRQRCLNKQYGKLGYILAWVLGVPIPVLLVVYLVRGCT